MTGGAGGLSGGLWALLRRRARRRRAAFVLDAVGFDDRLRPADASSSPGRAAMDEQTLTGKAVAEVATPLPRRRAAACHVVVGVDRLDRGTRSPARASPA